MTVPRQIEAGVQITATPAVKLAHGVELLETLGSRIHAWQTRGEVYIESKLSEDRTTVEATLRVGAQPPLTDYALLFGDAVRNVRSALDCLAWELCHLDGNSPTDGDRVVFPITMNEGGWKAKAKYLTSMPADVLGRIYERQPFNRPQPNTDILAVLARLTIGDNHQPRIRSLANISRFAFELVTDASHSPEPISNPESPVPQSHLELSDGALVARTTFTTPVELYSPSGVSPAVLDYFVVDRESSLGLASLSDALRVGAQQAIEFVCIGHYWDRVPD